MQVHNQTQTHVDQLTSFIQDSNVDVEMKLHSGEKVPVRFLVSGDVIEESSVVHTIEVAKTIFFKMDANGPRFKATESGPWQSFDKIFTGQLNASMEKPNSEAKLKAGVSLELNFRD
ncbi:MAG: hypothetical protein S4CHLAM6_08020 [Chlamydiae bacterium]|nr:hypothetical protein [Chlamydiota bacterium]